ncbi:zonular occludens toxin domain-containing protein [Acinetobacter tianfuensis]|uniref:Zona occludens toxin N-terminal domain-containing protein n=1 Tax=Acinetobacter tianfuensis TaxID=2419603 RepID=A0A3A8E380_9GAMM|nr:zonular occludens toxin domain-containing protein [Acinetobacter tianfuensis]RKG29115.1 hypothetical protein D7V32_16465 [Acinetobacter tianfuensis]
MITFISATPGGGKTLTAVDMLYKLSKENVKNLNFNYYLFKSTIEKIIELGLKDELRTVTITRGQGLHKKTSIFFFADDYFDFLLEQYHINIVLDGEYDELVKNYPEYYFERVYYLNEIIKRINKEHNQKFMDFKHVRAMFTNINGLLLSQVRPLPPDFDWRRTPFGAFIAYDEAQLIEIFSEEYKKVDPIVRDLTIHRHKSYDFIFISQDPGLVHKYIRKLASHHIHLINAFGFEQSVRIEWATCQEQPNALRNIARAEYNGIYRFPKQLYRIYISTTANTRVKRYPWKKIALISALGCVGLYGVSGLFAENNALVCMVTGGNYGCIDPDAAAKKEAKNEQDKSESKTANDSKDGSASDTSSASEPADKSKTEKNGTNPLDDNDASSAAVSAPVVLPEQIYDYSKPYDFEPVSMPAVANHRVFSGCVSFEGKHFAVDQQGTIIKQFSAGDCKKLLDKSYNRPFDYFGNRQQQVQQQQQTNEQSDSAYQQALIQAIAYQRAEQLRKSENPQLNVEQIPLNQPKSEYMQSANRH